MQTQNLREESWRALWLLSSKPILKGKKMEKENTENNTTALVTMKPKPILFFFCKLNMNADTYGTWI